MAGMVDHRVNWVNRKRGAGRFLHPEGIESGGMALNNVGRNADPRGASYLAKDVHPKEAWPRERPRPDASAQRIAEALGVRTMLVMTELTEHQRRRRLPSLAPQSEDYPVATERGSHIVSVG
jgi:hypothetical protein